MRASIDDLKLMVALKVDDIVARHLPGATLKSGKWLARNPNRKDRHANSFYVYGRGHAKAGAFVDYGSPHRGSPLDLIPFLVHGIDRPDPRTAIQLTKDYLGIADTTVDEAYLASLRADAERRLRDFEKRDAEERSRQAERAFALFKKAKPITGTPAQAYIEQARGVPLAALAEPPGALRFLPDEPNWEEPRGPDGKHPTFPTMLAAMSRWQEPVAALQRTSLTQDGQKAQARRAKLIYPSSVGAVIRLAKGANRLSPEKAAQAGLTGEALILCEGAEDGLSCMLARPDARVWAVCGVSNIQHVAVPPSVTRVIVAADADWEGSEARRALDLGLLALKEQRRDVSVAFPQVGKDFNDWLRG